MTLRGDLTFDLERPGKSYTVQTQFKNGSARVEERSKSFWQVINSLHAMGAVPNSRFSEWWGGYTGGVYCIRGVCSGFWYLPVGQFQT